MKVLIIGGGLGGLCLAQGLLKAGIPCEIYERETNPNARQGYRLHLDIRGSRGLEQCMPSNLYQLFLATTSKPSEQVTIVNEHLKQLHVYTFPTADPIDPKAFASTSVDRGVLSSLLRSGLSDCLHRGKQFVRYEQTVDNTIRAYFADGSSSEGDILVGADGINSKVRQQLLPESRIVDTGDRCIYGKTLITEQNKHLVPEFLNKGFVSILDRKQRLGMATGLVQYNENPDEAAHRLNVETNFGSTPNYMMWGLTGRSKDLGFSDRELMAMDYRELNKLVVLRTRKWDAGLHSLLLEADSEATFCLRMRTSVPLPHWQTTTVTLLGDAIHAMLPSRGSGANMALWDAGSLCNTLVKITKNEQPLLSAIEEYEVEMIKRGFDAVLASQEKSLAMPPLYRILMRALKFSVGRNRRNR